MDDGTEGSPLSKARLAGLFYALDIVTGSLSLYFMGRGFERYGDAAADHERRSALTDWCVRNDWFAAAGDCRVMHCLPVRRNVAIADEVLDSPRSVVQRQAANRLPAQMAVLHRLLAAREG